MGEHKTINMTGHWDMTPKAQIEAMTRGRSATTESPERVRAISRCLLEGRMDTDRSVPAATVVRGFQKK